MNTHMLTFVITFSYKIIIQLYNPHILGNLTAQKTVTFTMGAKNLTIFY